MSTTKNITAALEAFENESASSFYIPSLKREVKFKTFNIGQQKKLLKASIDNPVFQTRFVTTIYNIIVENCLEDAKKLNLSTIDYNSIVLQYRKSMYGDTVTVNEDNIAYKGDINESIIKINSIDPLPEQEVIEGSITLTLKTPTLQDLYQLEKEVRDGKTNDEQIVNEVSNVSSFIGDAFVGEVSKYVKEISFVKDGNTLSVGYSNLPFTEKFKLIERLPTSLVKKALPIIGELTNKLSNGLQITGVSSEGKNKVVTITLDAALFPVE